MADEHSATDPYDEGMRFVARCWATARRPRGRQHRRVQPALPGPHHAVCVGSVWAREGLDHRTRSCMTLALMCALGHDDELAMHVRAALRNGLTAADISEVLLHTAVYAGVPAANSALKIAKAVLEEEGAL